MTYEEAYLDGFCKAAEAVGANPVQLYKQAGLPGLATVSSLGGKALRGLKGGGATAWNAVRHPVTTGKAGLKAMQSGYESAKRGGGRLWELLKGGNKDVVGGYRMRTRDVLSPKAARKILRDEMHLRHELAAAGSVADREAARSLTNEQLGALGELRKVLAARLGVGLAGTAAAGGAGYGTYKALQDD